MKYKDLLFLMKKNEDEHVEFKKAKSELDLRNLTEYCAALANEGGGQLVLGITDKKPRKIVGTDAYKNKIEKTKHYLIVKIHLRVDIDEIDAPEGRVVVFDIPSRPIGMPIHIDGRYLMRAGGSLTAMSPDMLKRIFDESGPDFSAEICPGAVLDDLDTSSIGEFRKRWIQKSGNRKMSGNSDEQLLQDAELIVDGRITYSALILFGKKSVLGRHLGQSEVIFEYRQTDASGAAQQRIEYREGFFSYYDDLWNTIDLRNTNQHYQDGLFIFDIKTFNESAIREIILNAVCHRDYRMAGSVFVRQYPERIEVVNPGGLPPGITFENILWQQAPRNRRLAETFSRCGLVERSGQGMNRIFETCIRESKGEPDFKYSDKDHFSISLPGTIRHPEFLRVLEKIGNETLESFSTYDFIIIQSVFESRPLAERLEMDAERLCEQGLLERVSHVKKKKWILSRKLYSAVGKTGTYTRKKGLDRETNKALLLKHIETCGNAGARLEELMQILPFLNRGNIQTLLRELREDGIIHEIGKTRAGRWYPGPLKENTERKEV